MNKIIISCILIIVVIFLYQPVFASESIPKAEPENYCKNPESWDEWNKIVAKYPNDMDVQTLHALRLGLCLKIDQGSIKLEYAIDLFDRAHNMVIQKRFYELGEKERL